jgi:Uma2 family endonuclease
MSTTQSRLTFADLERLPDDDNRYELIDGELHMSKAPGLLHQRSGGKIYLLLGNFLADHPIGEVVFGPGVIFSDYDAVIPDLIYIGNERRKEIAAGERIHGAPDLAIEILSPGTRNVDRDRMHKLKLYGKFGVREYWIVDAQLRTVEVHRQEGAQLAPFRVFQAAEMLETPLLPGFRCTVAQFFA